MFNIFKTKQKSFVKTISDKMMPKSQAQIIEEIHETFYTEVNRLLQDAKIAHSLDTDKSALIEKCNRLKALGFSNTKEVQEAHQEIQRLDVLRQENERKQNVIQAINYFSAKYPIYKFITEDSVKMICEKYGLIYGTVERYLGTVPDKNLKQIEAFKIKQEDECWEIFSNSMSVWSTGPTKLGDTSYSDALNRGLTNQFETNFFKRNHYSYERGKKAPLEICATPSEFNTKGMEVVGHKLVEIVKEDPIVLAPVFFEGSKYYLIVTAWGPEASDEAVVNQKFN